jgi:sortase A
MIFRASPAYSKVKRRAAPASILSRRAKLLWTLGNLLILLGVLLLLYVGGLYAQVEYGRYAARGDTDAPPPQVRVVVPPQEAAEGSAEPAPFAPPVLTQAATEGQLVVPAPEASPAPQPATISRLVIPSIGVDSKVVEVGWEMVEQNGQQVAVWQVAEYAVGQHRGSANPGDGDNIVMAGHVGGYGKVFKDLYYVQPGDALTVYSAGEQYLYIVTERLVVDEEGVSEEQRAANARYIEPTGAEMVTLVTCWPATGPNKFSQRVIVRATPYRVDAAGQAPVLTQWSVR